MPDSLHVILPAWLFTPIIATLSALRPHGSVSLVVRTLDFDSQNRHSKDASSSLARTFLAGGFFFLVAKRVVRECIAQPRNLLLASTNEAPPRRAAASCSSAATCFFISGSASAARLCGSTTTPLRSAMT